MGLEPQSGGLRMLLARRGSEDREKLLEGRTAGELLVLLGLPSPSPPLHSYVLGGAVVTKGNDSWTSLHGDARKDKS